MKYRQTQAAILTAVLYCGLLFGTQSFCMAGGLTSAFGKVKVENLQPGKTYRASKFYQEIVVVNASDDPTSLLMELLKPNPKDLDPEFEPIPDITWATLARDRMELEPWQDGISDLVLTIPPDKEYWGKKYQLNIWSRTEGSGNISVGLLHKLLFTIAEKPSPDGGKEPNDVLRFELDPFEITATGVKFGRPIDLTELSGSTLTLKNISDKVCLYRVETVRYETAPIVNLKNYEPTPANIWLSLGDREFELGPKESKEIPLIINIPRNRNYRGKKYLFLIRTTVLNGDAPFSMISRLYVETSERLLD